MSQPLLSFLDTIVMKPAHCKMDYFLMRSNVGGTPMNLILVTQKPSCSAFRPYSDYEQPDAHADRCRSPKRDELGQSEDLRDGD